MKHLPPIKAISLFSGCGGSDIGLKQAGVETVWANDISESACALYDSVTGTKGIINHSDISKIDSFPSAELLVGCYPCQGYSQGGKRDVKNPINYLYRHFDRALRLIKPKAFIVENVNGMRFSQNEHLFKAQLTRFRLAGYSVVYKLLDAREFGLAQDRKRLFIVGIKSSLGVSYQFPTPSHGPKGEQAFATLKDVIGQFKQAPPGSYNTEPFHWYYLSRNRRREWHEQAPCIVAHWRHVGLHPDSPPLVKIGTDHWEFTSAEKARRFSYLECAALQGFPDPSAFNIRSVQERFRAIGNAVPPPLFAAVSRALIKQAWTTMTPSQNRKNCVH